MKTRADVDAEVEAARLIRWAMSKIEHKLAGEVSRWFQDAQAWLDEGCDCERFEGDDHGRFCASRDATARRAEHTRSEP